LLLVIWWAGAAAAGFALLFPRYNDFFAVGVAGWVTLLTSSGLMLYEIRRIKSEDRKKKRELA
jgi:hypothetical protein